MKAPRDLKALAQARFATPDSCLSGLEIIERYATDAPLVVRTLLDAVRSDSGGARICELGFGTGWLLEEMAREFVDARLFGLDLSPGMVARAREQLGSRVEVAVGDMERLPFAYESFDAVVTCWTLYFMRDIDAALVEIKRTLRPGGRLVAATNAPDHMREYDELCDAAHRIALGRPDQSDPTSRFDLAAGRAYIERHFSGVELVEWRGEMPLAEASLAVVFWDQWAAPSLSTEDAARVRAEFVRLAQDRIDREGVLRVRRHGGAFVGRKDG